MVAVDGTVEMLMKVAHYLLMQKCTFTVHHVCMQSFESGLLLMLEGWQAVQEANWEGGTSLVSVTFSTAWPNSWSHCCLHRCWPWTLSLARCAAQDGNGPFHPAQLALTGLHTLSESWNSSSNLPPQML